MALLDRIKTGRLKLPIRLIVHGPGGIGKSTFAAGAPDPVFLDVERRSNHLDVARFEPDSWVESVNFLSEVRQSGQYKTLVIDTLDHLELQLWAHICAQYKASTLETVAGGYGKGYKIALDEWRRLVTYLEGLRAAGIGVVLLAHSQIRTCHNPAGEDYDVWSMKLHERASALLREKADAVGFACWDDIARKPAGGGNKAKVISSGDRDLHFGHNPAFESKAGFDLPDSMSLDWAEFQTALTKFYSKS